MSDELRSFTAARKTGDIKGMQTAVAGLVQNGTVRQGMTIDEITAILGKPNSQTGIYVPGGTSIGYGTGHPGTEDHTFYWLHFRAEDWNTKNPQAPCF